MSFLFKKSVLFDSFHASLCFPTLREIEGQVYVGKVNEKEKAREQYDKAVSKGQTAGLVK